MKTCWFVTELYWPEDTSTGHFITGLAEGISGKADVRVLTVHPTYAHRHTASRRSETRRGVLIKRVFSTRMDKDSVIGRALNYLTTSLSLFWSTVRSVRAGHVAVAVTNPPTLPYLVALACKIRRASYYLIVHDVFPDLPIALGWFDGQSLIARAWRSAARWLYVGSAGIAVCGRDMAELVAATMSPNESNDKIRVVTNWADLDTVKPMPKSKSILLKESGIEDKFVVQFAGNVGPVQDLPTIVDALERVEAEDVHLLVVGSGRKRSWLESAVRARGLDNVTILDPRRRAEAGDVHSACDVAIVSLIDGMFGVSVPSRAYNFMAAGRPIIAAVEPDSEIGRMVSQGEVGWVTGSGRADALASAIDVAAQDPEAARAMGARARVLAEACYSRDRSIEDLAHLLGLQLDTGSTTRR